MYKHVDTCFVWLRNVICCLFLDFMAALLAGQVAWRQIILIKGSGHDLIKGSELFV
jgi:hypothetical protein